VIAKRNELKPVAISMRKKGNSIGKIERELKIPRSTLGGWFKNIELTKSQKIRLHKNLENVLNRARKRALIWHHLQKEKRLEIARVQAAKTLNKINYKDKNILELNLAMLYLGEGDKTQQTSMGSTNVLILRFFIRSLNLLFDIDSSMIKCELHLRSDQNEKELIEYWSRQLNLSINVFTSVKDKRTAKSKTYPNYKGVCVVRCGGNIAIQRRLMYLGQEYCKICSDK